MYGYMTIGCSNCVNNIKESGVVGFIRVPEYQLHNHTVGKGIAYARTVKLHWINTGTVPCPECNENIDESCIIDSYLYNSVK